MHYVKQFDINGVDTKQVACIELHGKPNAATEGYVGVLGIDIDSPIHDVYKCVAVNGSIYTWELLSSGLSIMSASISGAGAKSFEFPYAELKTPQQYVVKVGDLILDKEGYLYQISALGASSCGTNYCGTQVVAYGMSAYKLAVEHGFEGTEEEWLASLKGEPGESLMGTDCESISEDAVAIGNGTLAGSKGFRITASADNGDDTGTYVLDGYEGGFEVGDVYTLRTESCYDRHGTIKAINGNAITVDNFVTDGFVPSSAVYTVRGTWEWNEKISVKINEDVNFVYNDVNYIGIRYVDTYVDPYEFDESLNYIKTDGTKRVAYAYLHCIHGHDRWVTYRTIDFGVSQEVSKAFYEALLSNAQPIDGAAEIVGNYDEDVYTFRVPDKPTVGNVDIGVCATAFGCETVADGVYAHAEGCGTKATGKYSHAEGKDTVAIYASHAEGRESKALGQTSHAEGWKTLAKGNYSHTEGHSTEATKDNAHAEGWNTHATGESSHAEGNETTASGTRSHSEGYGTKATANFTHAEGKKTTASGESSHSEGDGTVASARATHAEGVNTTASAQMAHTEGYNTNATAEMAHAEGANTTASGKRSHAEGNGSTASGDRSHAEGETTTASGNAAHAEGNHTKAKGAASHAGGLYTVAESDYQTVFGKFNRLDTEGKYALIIGNGKSETDRSNALAVDWLGNIVGDNGVQVSKVFHGSYTGDDVVPSSESPVTLNLPFEPKLLIISGGETVGYMGIWVKGSRYLRVQCTSSDNSHLPNSNVKSTFCYVSSETETFAWWTLNSAGTGVKYSLNSTDYTYHYVAIG